MDNQTKYLVLAMFVQALFPAVVMILMFLRKIHAVKTKQVRARAFKLNLPEAGIPESVVVVSNHYNNLFQMPVYFLIVGVLAISLNLVDSVIVVMGWFFVATRLAHSYVHLTSNHVQKRYIVFGLSCLILFGIWGYLLGKVFLQ